MEPRSPFSSPHLSGSPALSSDAWLKGDSVPFSVIRDSDFGRFSELSQIATDLGLVPVLIDSGTCPSSCYQSLTDASEGYAPVLELGPQGRAIAVRLGRSIRAVAGMTTAVPRRREGVSMLASRLIHYVLTQTNALLVLDLRHQADAQALVRRFSEPWLNSSTARFLERGAKVTGRVSLILPSNEETRLPTLTFQEQSTEDGLVRFVSRNIDAVAVVLWQQVNEDCRKVWSVLDALARPTAAKPLAALVRSTQKVLFESLESLQQYGIVRCKDETFQLVVAKPPEIKPDLDEDLQLVEGLKAQILFGRDVDACLDLTRLAPDVLANDVQLHELVPEMVRGLRAEWRHNDALRLVACVPESFEAKIELARTLLDLGRDEEAVTTIQDLSNVKPKGTGTMISALCTEALISQSTNVLAAFEPLKDIFSIETQRVLSAHEAYNHGDPKNAVRLLEGIESPDASLIRSRALLADHRYAEARVELQNLSSFKNFEGVAARIRANLAITDIGSGQYEKAARELRSVLGLFDESALELEGALTLGNLGIALEYLGQYSEAERAFIESVARMAVRPTFHGRIRNLIALGELQSTLGRFEQSRKTLTVAVETANVITYSGLELDAQIQLASTYFDEGLIPAARGHLKKCALAEDASEEALARIKVLEYKCALYADEVILEDPGEAPGNWSPSTQTQWALVRAWWATLNKPGFAVEILEKLIAKADASGDGALRWESRLLLASAMNRLGAVDSTMKLTQQALSLLDDIMEGLSPADRTSFKKRPWPKKLCSLLDDLPVEDRLNGKSVPSVVAGRVPSKPTGRIIGKSVALLESLAFAERYAETNAPVLIQGESGTGKELVAELIHSWSPRSGKVLVRVNAAAISETLLLSELFGHERGSFTGAERRKAGKFELAAGGTLFLDEIGDISPSAQVALLRVLQDGTFNRVGGNESVKSDVRVIVATNRNLKSLVDQGKFRLDLYYRISGLSLNLPPLREREGDFSLLVVDLLKELSGDGASMTMEPSALRILKRHSWPGNVRELRNVLQRLIHLADGGTITAEMVQAYGPAVVSVKSTDVEAMRWEPGPGFSLSRIHRQVEIDYIQKALTQSKGNIAAAARLLGMTRPKLSRKVKEYGLK